MISSIRTFLRLESASGILLILAAALAMLCANTDLKHLYERLLQIQAGVQFGEFQIQKPLLLWINDGLMVLFFFVVGMELKRELLEGGTLRYGECETTGAGRSRRDGSSRTHLLVDQL